jgi:hypothetical protein
VILGLIIGIVIGGVAAQIMAANRGEHPDLDANTLPEQAVSAGGVQGILDDLRQRANDAMEAAHDASEAKQSEMLRAYDEETRRHSP